VVAHVSFTLAGAVFELGGLTLVVLDARDARRRATQVVKREHRVYLGSAVLRAKSGLAGVLTGGREPTIEERVVIVERAVTALGEELTAKIELAEDRARADVTGAHEQAMTHADELDRDVRDFIASDLSSGRSISGVILFAFGVVFSAAANLT
jgi:hypothetical protein